eukprot:4024124-Amphidinium_carterae.1
MGGLPLQRLVSGSPTELPEMWSLAAQRLQTRNVLRTSDGAYPIKEAMAQARMDPFLHAVMQPLPLAAHIAAAASSSMTGSSGSSKRPSEPQRNESKRPKTQGKGGGKARTKYTVAVPESQRKYHTRTPEGRNVCFSFNLEAAICEGMVNLLVDAVILYPQDADLPTHHCAIASVVKSEKQ